MNRVTIDLRALKHNLKAISKLIESHGATWSLATKALCGHVDTIRALRTMGVRSIADSRLDNLRAIDRAIPGLEKWYSAFVRLMNDPYTPKEVVPDIETFQKELPSSWSVEVPPILKDNSSQQEP